MSPPSSLASRAEVESRRPHALALLGPDGRPVQLTRDLRGFWERTVVASGFSRKATAGVELPPEGA